MITQFNASRSGYWSRIMILPVAFILFCAISLYAQRSTSAQHTGLSLSAGEQPFVLMIDAGHGGNDPGAKSADGKHSEKDIALAIAKNLRDEAEAAGIKVLMSRATDVSLSVQERSALNTSQKPDLFVSIHIGAGPEPLNNSIGGAEAFIGSNKQQNRIPSIELGNSILNALQPVIKVNTPVKERNNAGIWVLDQSPCPAVLIHCGFMTNPVDVAFISEEVNQQKLAKNILHGIIQFQNNAIKANPSSTKVMIAETTKQLLVRNYIKKLRYPIEASENNEGSDLYFSIKIKEDAGITDLRFYNEPSGLKGGRIQQIVIVSEGNKNSTNNNMPNEVGKEDLFKEEIEKATEAIQESIDFSEYESGIYLFKVSFRIESVTLP